MPSASSDGFSFEYSVERSRRRTIAIHVHPQNGVTVRVPKRAGSREIHAIVMKKSKWIVRKLGEVQQRAQESPSHTYRNGDAFLFLGEPLVLRIAVAIDARRDRVDIVGQDLVITLKAGTPPESIPAILKKWYCARARKIFTERISHYSGLLGIAPSRVAVRNQSRRWGSCSTKGNVNLNLKLVMAPPLILDYVVAHELCHLRHPDHSPQFWNLLAGIMPDFAERRKWLKTNGHRLEL